MSGPQVLVDRDDVVRAVTTLRTMAAVLGEKVEKGSLIERFETALASEAEASR